MAPNQMIHALTKPPKKMNTGSLAVPERAYVTFLAGDGDYVKGVVGLVKGLRKAKSSYPLVVAVLPDVPKDHRRLLISQGCIVREIELLLPPINPKEFARSYYMVNYCKLRLWEFVEYGKMVYLDADVQVFSNIDDLFELPDGYLYAVVDCVCQLKKGQHCSENLPWPTELGPKPPVYFNAGVLIFEPSLSTFNDLVKTLQETPPTAFAEQDLLNLYFKDTYMPIRPTYNLLLAMLWRHPEDIEVEKVKVVHYCWPGSKPWRYTATGEFLDRDDVKMFVDKWWEIYNDDSLNHDHINSILSV